MLAAEARVSSEKASRYLVQLCKHFAHKTTAEYDADQGRVDFQPGACLFRATEAQLLLMCEAETAEDLERIKLVVADHLVRFARGEDLRVEWADRPTTSGDG
ncbi:MULTISPECIES: DUF2218 domain-containing protein [Hyphomicrobium]|jgi:hypothetical protein|uniref:DUF2218 domain-containing protein n=1 Tax=Hyphomicrobium TaxID=81 RepID=UPI00037788E5|nr:MULTISPECIES: DUF2218 domain-containing protein [Hyphomicrobium]WBT40266.1 DUF2218 domain-containing protein [Hyphomicrobium sp. DMF-1]HML42370.1 DUF2218 domain-containing protein [Hyphomicrobium zavarzinii]